MTRIRAFFFSLPCLLAAPLAAQNPIGGGSCGASNLNGSYSLILSGRAISSAGSFAGSFQGVGSASFDGQGAVTLTGTDNTNLAQGKPFTFTGTYTVPSNCFGTISVTSPGAANFSLVVWNNGKNFNIVGTDANYVYSGSGGSFQPVACAKSTLSGKFLYSASGFTLSGTTQNGAGDESGIFQFDGQGNVTASYTVTSASGAQPKLLTSSGTYTLTSGCQVSATMTDSNGATNNLNLVITGPYGQAFDLLEANSGFVRAGAAHSLVLNPTQSIGNVASYAVNATPPGSVFVLFGTNLATKEAGAVTTNLPTTLLTTSVTVNGEPAPLFYVNTGQIDAQMPWDIPGGAVATVIVTNGNTTSNAAAVYVPATGTPGLSMYGNNRAVVVNTNGTVNSASDPAAVNDEVVAYFTGGGPVNAAGKLVSGQPAPSGLSPVSGEYSVTVGGVNANVDYIGLTPLGIGLYQVNFNVPQLDKGTYPVVITIAGQASNGPVMNVSN
jgi:uncharacterized protein (TIGR03437 family)